MRSGVNFINALEADFAPVDPKSVKRYWQLKLILMLLGATGVKAVRKYVGEIEPRSISTTCLLAALTPADPKAVKRLTTWLSFFTLSRSTSIKAARKTMVKLTPD